MEEVERVGCGTCMYVGWWVGTIDRLDIRDCKCWITVLLTLFLVFFSDNGWICFGMQNNRRRAEMLGWRMGRRGMYITHP